MLRLNRSDLFQGVVCLAVTAVIIAARDGICQETDFIFPTGSGIIDVTKSPYNANKTGTVDVTNAIQQALNAYAGQNRIIYLPNGTYLVSNTLRWGAGEKRTILQGQSRSGAVIRLKDNCTGFQDTTVEGRKGVIWTGIAPAQRFRNCIWSLTVNTGRGNPGASGIQYMTNNQGTMRHVKIISEDGRGYAGLDVSYADEIGPGYVYDLEVHGFRYGVSAYVLNSLTFERIRVEGQTIAGFRNYRHVVTIRGFVSVNTVPAVNNDEYGCMVLLDVNASGGSSPAAIINNGYLYARGIETSGYARAIDNRRGTTGGVTGTSVERFVSHSPRSLFPSAPQSLELEARDTPEIPWDPLPDWVSPMDFGAVGDGRADDTRALQAAIDAGKPTVYLPGGKTFRFTTIYLRGKVRRLIGCESYLGPGVIRFGDGDAPIVVIERIDCLYRSVKLFHESSRTLVVRSTTALGVEVNGSGDLFVEDYCSGTLLLNKPGQHTWARQINTENGSTPNVVNNGAVLWLMLLKTENEAVKLETRNGGLTELLGAHIYAQGGAKTTPLFVINNAAASFAIARQLSYSNRYYSDVVQETREGETKLYPYSTAGSILVLYSANPAVASRSPVIPAPPVKRPRRPLVPLLKGGSHPRVPLRGFDFSGKKIDPGLGVGTEGSRIIVTSEKDPGFFDED